MVNFFMRVTWGSYVTLSSSSRNLVSVGVSGRAAVDWLLNFYCPRRCDWSPALVTLSLCLKHFPQSRHGCSLRISLWPGHLHHLIAAFLSALTSFSSAGLKPQDHFSYWMTCHLGDLLNFVWIFYSSETGKWYQNLKAVLDGVPSSRI